MSIQALRDAFRAGFVFGFKAPEGVTADAAFDHWWQNAVDGVDRSPTVQAKQLDLWNPVTLDVLCNATNPPKPVGIYITDSKGRFVAGAALDELKRCAADLARLEEAARK